MPIKQLLTHKLFLQTLSEEVVDIIDIGEKTELEVSQSSEA